MHHVHVEKEDSGSDEGAHHSPKGDKSPHSEHSAAVHKEETGVPDANMPAAEYQPSADEANFEGAQDNAPASDLPQEQPTPDNTSL